MFSATSTRIGAVACAGGRCWPVVAIEAIYATRSTTQSMQAVSACTSAGSIAGNIATRSWLRPSLR